MKFWQWLDSNCGPQMSKATTVPTEPQLMPKLLFNSLRYIYRIDHSMYAALGKSNSEKAHSTVEILQDTDCVVERTYLCRNVVAQFGFFF